jgi:hypothetical protein
MPVLALLVLIPDALAPLALHGRAQQILYASTASHVVSSGAPADLTRGPSAQSALHHLVLKPGAAAGLTSPAVLEAVGSTRMLLQDTASARVQWRGTSDIPRGGTKLYGLHMSED